jgi:hypothetical protein
MLRDNEREGGSVDRGRTRVDGDKNGLRMGMSGLYPYSTLPFVQQLIISLYHLSSTTCHLNSTHTALTFTRIPNLNLDHIPTSSLIFTMDSLSLHLVHNALGLNVEYPTRLNLLLHTMNTQMIQPNHLYPSPSPSSLLNYRLSRDLLLPMLFEPSLSLSPLHLHLPRSLRSFPLKQTH